MQFTPDGKLALIPHAQASALVVADVDRHAFVTVRNDDSMLVLDLVTGETLARVPVQSSPDGVTYSAVHR